MSRWKSSSGYRSPPKKQVSDAVALPKKYYETKLYRQDEVGYTKAQEQQDKRWEYLQKTVPEVLKILTNAKLSPDGVHVGSILFSKEKGKIGGIKGAPIRKHSPYGEEEYQSMYVKTKNDIDDFTHKEGKFIKAHCAGHKGFTTLFYTHNYENIKGFPPSKMTILDLNPIGEDPSAREEEKVTNEKNWRKWVKKVARKYMRDYKVMILYTGNRWQIYLKSKDGKRTTYAEKRDHIIQPIAEKLGIHMGNPAISKITTWKTTPEIPFFIDYSAPNKPNAMERAPLASIHVLTGLVAVPVDLSKITTFNPKKEAHPVYVEKNLKRYLKKFEKFMLD